MRLSGPWLAQPWQHSAILIYGQKTTIVPGCEAVGVMLDGDNDLCWRWNHQYHQPIELAFSFIVAFIWATYLLWRFRSHLTQFNTSLFRWVLQPKKMMHLARRSWLNSSSAAFTHKFFFLSGMFEAALMRECGEFIVAKTIDKVYRLDSSSIPFLAIKKWGDHHLFQTEST